LFFKKVTFELSSEVISSSVLGAAGFFCFGEWDVLLSGETRGCCFGKWESIVKVVFEFFIFNMIF